MSSSEGFDRQRILEWLQGISSPAVHSQSPEPDRGLTSSPDPRAVTPPPPPSGQQQSQWHHQHNVHHLPPYQHRITFGHIFTPLQRSNPPRAMSAGNIACTNSAAPSRTNPSPSQQELLMSLHQRQKSESPLPDMPVDAELPTFVPQNPVLPQRRLLSQATRPEISVTTTTTSGRGPSHVAQESSLGSAVIGRLTRPSNADHSNTKAKSAPVSPDQMRKTVAKSLAAIPSGWEGGRGEGGQRNPGEIQVAISPPTSPSSLGRDWGSHISNHGSDLRRSPLTFSEGDSERSEECSKGKVERDVIPSPSLSTNQLTTNTSRSRSKIPSPAPVSMATGRESTQSPQPARKVQGAAPPLRPTELATLSLLVVDTLPQLIVFLGMDYSEYEKITSEETSPQRQSLKVLMKWYSSGSGCREDLAHALEKCGNIREAKQLLDGELEEFGVKRDADVRHPKDLKRTTHSFLPSPLPPTPSSTASQVHHCRPSSPLLTFPRHSSEAKQSGGQSPALPPATLSLSEVKRKQLQLQHTFTFDEEQISGNLPKFLSNQSLLTSPEHSHYPHHHPHTYTPHPSQLIPRRKSCSDKSTASPTTPASLTSPTQTMRKGSLLSEELIRLGSRRGSEVGAGSPRSAGARALGSPGYTFGSQGLSRGTAQQTSSSQPLIPRHPPSVSEPKLYPLHGGKTSSGHVPGSEQEREPVARSRGKVKRQDSGIETLYSTNC